MSPECASTIFSRGILASRDFEVDSDRNEAQSVELVECADRELVNWVCCDEGLRVIPDSPCDVTEDGLLPLSLQSSGDKWCGEVASFKIRTISSVSNPETVGMRSLDFCSLDANRLDSDRMLDFFGCPLRWSTSTSYSSRWSISWWRVFIFLLRIHPKQTHVQIQNTNPPKAQPVRI